MRRIMLCISLLCLNIIARGQTAYEYVYWFDGDYATRQSSLSSGNSWQFEADVSRLDASLHTLHVQVCDTAGLWSSPMTRMFVNLHNVSVKEGRYWFDNEDKVIHSVQNVSGLFDVDVSPLDDGLHTIYYLTVDAKGNVSSPVSRTFVKVPQTDSRGIYRCWFDNRNETMVSGPLTGDLIWLDVSALDDGLHTLFVQAEKGTDSPTLTCQFLKIPQVIGAEYFICLCYLDGKLFQQKRVESTDGIINWELDVNELPLGVHSIQIQVVTPSGASTRLYESMFLRTATEVEISPLKCFYAIDSAQSCTEVGTYANGAFHFDLDVSSLDDGLHQLIYMLVGDNGVSTKANSAFFMKTSLGGNGITQYWYWLNDNEAEKTVVKLKEHANLFQLIGLLPVKSVPIRSSCFHFEVDEEKGPMLYAKNEFHVRFFDATGRLVDATKPYLDYNVSEKVTGAEEIKKTQTFVRPAVNDIKWYTLQACEGDTIAFRSSQALSLQVFSPSGKEIYAASGAESVKWGGIHTWEEGTHYVALHDVTGSQPNVTLDYLHMDKYDVVDQDVRVVGNGGCSTITFYGNGFNDLYAVDLVNASGDTIDSKAIHHESDATVNITFDFTDKPIGRYTGVFHFTTEDRTFADILTVEEARDITLDLKVEYPSTFLRGTSVTYTIAVTNNGNATAYDVPLELRLRSGGAFSEIESVTFTDDEGKEFNCLRLDDLGIELDTLEEETLVFLEEQLSVLDGLQTFFVVRDSITNEEFGYTDLYLTIEPEETTVFYITLRSLSSVKLEAIIPSEWITINTRDTEQRSKSMMRGASQDGFCCYKEAIECLVSVVTTMAGMYPVAGCIGLLDHYAYTTIEIACSEGHSLGDKALDFFRSMAEDSEKYDSYKKRGQSAIIGCVTGKLLEKLIANRNLWEKALKGLKDKLSTTQKVRDINLRSAKDAAAKRIAYANKADDLTKQAILKEYDGDKEGAKELYDAAAKAQQEVAKYRELENMHDVNVNSLNIEIESIKKLIEEAIDNLISIAKNSKEVLDGIKTGIDTAIGATECRMKWDETVPNCPPKPKKGGGTSSPVNSYDPNAIYGYISPSGSMFIAKDSVEAVNYRVEFENDTAFATSAAHVVEICDTLDARFFELSTFAPTYFNIGDKRELLDGTPNFVRTVDMRPEINTIVQVKGQYDEQTGIARWRFTSLDPMTMEPTDDLMQGFLPVNYDGTSGIGDVGYRIRLKRGLADGTEITNRASIVFDYNEPILTPTWTNIVDGVCPEIRVADVTYKNDSIVTLSIEGSDERSGIWKYDLYVQYGYDSPWIKEAELAADSTAVDFRIYDGLYYGFCALATDSAGNVEQKVLQPEALCAEIHLGDVNSDGVVNERDAQLTMDYYLEKPVAILAAAADVNEDGEVNTLDVTLIMQMYLNVEDAVESAPVVKQYYMIRR